MSIIIQKIKTFLTSLLFYPIFVAVYLVYSLGYRIATLAQYLFTVIYIEQICGFKNREKIISGINSFNKVPEDMAIVYSINKFMIESEQNALTNNQIQQKIINQHLDILNKVEALKKITIYLDSESQYLSKLIYDLEKRISEISTQKDIRIIKVNQIAREQVEILQIPDKSYTPFVVVFSNYESVCNIPSKYLVNAEIAFNSGIFSSSKYDIYKSFAQYAESKQRNGK